MFYIYAGVQPGSKISKCIYVIINSLCSSASPNERVTLPDDGRTGLEIKYENSKYDKNFNYSFDTHTANCVDNLRAACVDYLLAHLLDKRPARELTSIK